MCSLSEPSNEEKKCQTAGKKKSNVVLLQLSTESAKTLQVELKMRDNGI